MTKAVMHDKPTADWVAELNALGKNRRAALFMIDFEGQSARIWPTASLDPRQLQFNFRGVGNDLSAPPLYYQELIESAQFPHPANYQAAFEIVAAGLQRGDSFLTNLTMPVPVKLTAELYELYAAAKADYRLWWNDRLACFSPETFVRISGEGRISSYPMKGTALDNPAARTALLESEKEVAEHATIVDLIRNDLSRVAKRVRVDRYRYLQKIESPRGNLLQTSSEISGTLGAEWQDRLGSILANLLPAGSVSGAPKPATLDIIRRAEGQDRAYYCGIAGFFDGRTFDSCVLIRLVEKLADSSHRFWAGGGITTRSVWEEEYRELCNKVRIPRAVNSFSLH